MFDVTSLVLLHTGRNQQKNSKKLDKELNKSISFNHTETL